MSQSDAKMSKKALNDLKVLNKNYDPAIYNISINAVQLRKAMIDWKWAVDFGLSDFAKSFIKRYDMNGDGRLNVRELILGSIEHNKHLFGSQTCTHCYDEISRKLDAIFMYLDCDNDGLLSAEDLWNNLSKLKRPSGEYNMFVLANDAGIRTAAVNDFILKNMKIRNGNITKVEFRNAIIFGMWDRQTDFYKIIEDESRTLKDLRWKDDNMVDIKAYQYIKELMLRDAQNKAKQM